MNTKKRWAVSCVNYGDNELTTEIVYANDWREAAMQHKNIAEWFSIDESNEKDRLPDDQEDAKQAAFDMDCMLNVVEIPKD